MGYTYKKGYWETKDHKRIKIKDMETSHIENTIKFLKERPHFYDETYDAGYTCDGEGDGQIIDYIDNSHLVNKKIKELELELELRLRKIENMDIK